MGIVGTLPVPGVPKKRETLKKKTSYGGRQSGDEMNMGAKTCWLGGQHVERGSTKQCRLQGPQSMDEVLKHIGSLLSWRPTSGPTSYIPRAVLDVPKEGSKINMAKFSMAWCRGAAFGVQKAMMK